MDLESSEVDGKMSSENEMDVTEKLDVGTAMVISDVTAVDDEISDVSTTITSDEKAEDDEKPYINTNVSAVETVDGVTSSSCVISDDCSRQTEENDQISAEIKHQVDTPVCDVQPTSVPGNEASIAIEKASHQTPENNIPVDSTTFLEPSCDGTIENIEGAISRLHTNFGTIDSKDADIAMETEDSEADSSCNLSQIQITCVQSIATDSLGMTSGDNIHNSLSNEELVSPPVTSQVSAETAMEVTSGGHKDLPKVTTVSGADSDVCVEVRYEISSKVDVVTTVQGTNSSSDAHQDEDTDCKDYTPSDYPAISTVVKRDSDPLMSANIPQRGIALQSEVTSYDSATSLEATEIQNNLSLTSGKKNNLPKTTEVQRNSPQTMEVQRNSPQTMEVPKTTEVRRNSPQTTEVQRNSPQTTEVQRNSPQTMEVQRNSPQTTEVQRNAPQTMEVQNSLPQTTEVRRDSPQTMEVENSSSTMTEIQHNSPQTIEMEKVSPETTTSSSNSSDKTEIHNVCIPSNTVDEVAQSSSSSAREKNSENFNEPSSVSEKESNEITVTFNVRSSGETTPHSTITSSTKSSERVNKVINSSSNPQLQAVQSETKESSDLKKSSISQKFSTYTLNKARSMLHSALGTKPVMLNHQSQSQQLKTSQSTAVDNGNLPVKVMTDPSNHDKVEEHGDILDILKTHQKETAPESKSQKALIVEKTSFTEKSLGKVSNQIAKKSTTKKPVVMIKDTSGEPSVKQEPVDSYNGYGQSAPVTGTTNSQVSNPAVVIENVHGTSSTVNRSSVSLSSQSNSIPTVVTSYQKNLVPSVAMLNANPNQVFNKLVPSDPMRVIATTLMNSTSSDLNKTNRFVPVMAGLGPGKGPNRVTIRLSNSTASASNPITIPRMSKPYRAPRPIQPKEPEIPQPKASVIPVTTKVINTISTPALLQTNATIKTTIPPPMSVTTINIDTVGLPRITELIARKNPIPNYKAPVIPQNLKGMIKEDHYLCYECGDVFWIESSLHQHRGRYSMKITYKCDECNKEKCFFNKCQFLGHLRQHLNIDKSQAVPIHIKSDSISIAPLPKVYESLIFHDATKLSEEKKSQKVVKDIPSKKRCRECGVQLPVEEMKSHYNTNSTNCDFWNCCSICHMPLPSICALRAHRRLHTDSDASNCPECGEQFFKEVITYKEKPLDSRSAFIQHLRYQCCHIGRIAQMSCPKCQEMLESGPQIKNHALSKLDQYYKCQVCPMAFRTAAGFERHFVSHQKGKPLKKDYKRIYKCHICDTVLDDITVLEIHVAGHVKELKKTCTYGFVCIDCRQVFPSKEDLSKHIKENHPQIANKTVCMKCYKSFGSMHECFFHDLLIHRSSVVPEYRPCKICGNVMEIDAFLSHPCNKKKTKEKYVCNFCDKEIMKKTHLTKHMEWHKSNGAAVCLMCFRTDFADVAELKSHELTCQSAEHGQAKPAEKCGDCNLPFVNKDALEKHRAQKHPTLFPCHLCGDTYQSKEDLKNHVSVKHVAKRHVYPCHICNSRGIKRAFSSNTLLEKHLSCRHRQGKNQVISQKFLKQEDEESSGDTDQDKEDVEISKRKIDDVPNSDQPFKKLRVEGEKRFTCAKCSLTCEDRSTFLKHLVDHKVENFIQCMECGLSFAVLPSLRKHLFMVHKVKDFNTYCHDNNIEDTRDVDYDREIRDIPPVPEMKVLHDSDSMEEDDGPRNPLECRVCHRVFETDADLRTHTRTHGMAFIRNKRRNKMVPSATTRPPQLNGVNTDEEDSSLSME